MACPCCATDVCLCSDSRTRNCTYTISLSVPEKNYFVSLPITCSSRASNLFGYGTVRQSSNFNPALDPGVQSLFNTNTAFFTQAGVGGSFAALMKDCPQSLNAPLEFPYEIAFASQGCDITADSGSLPGTAFHIIVLMVNYNSVLVGDRNRYHYLYRITVDPSTNAVSASVAWHGQTGVRSTICFPAPSPQVRCLPCFTTPDSHCGTNEGWEGSGHCPYDITTVTPTLTIACPP